MEEFSSVLLLFSAFVFIALAHARLLIYLRYFQQEEYDAKRFFRWIAKYSAFDKRGFAVGLIAFLSLYLSNTIILPILIIISGYLYLTINTKDPRKVGKIKLNMTARASRIFYIALLILIAIFISMALPCLSCHEDKKSSLFRFIAIQILLLQFIPLSLVISNFLLSPFEKRTKLKFKNEAINILKSINPYVIGITGSYGKTSVKSALGEVLNLALAPTFCPPKSINTEMGITREIRERMKPEQKYAVIEMGAYNVGSIDRLCKLTPPQAGLVTVVGMAHLERYGTAERVYQAKSELAKWVPQGSILVCNGDNEGSRRMATEFPKKTTLLYGLNPEHGHLDCKASNIVLSLDGMTFDLDWQGKTYSGSTRLLGRPALSNLIGVFTMACVLGADPDYVLAIIRNLKPVDNRLSLSKEGEIYFLRDAYNSNPLGFDAALDVLKQLPAKRKILMTPGMVELGDQQFVENKKAAQMAANFCDAVILVGEINLTALKEGLQVGGLSENSIYICKTRDEAFKKLNEIIKAGDLVLIENDLPDLYEVEEKF